ncbi:hypothetical protein [Nostoc sp. CALU 1950]|uniref:hypothetical protein n=1 Tax=Nostoc sp. CALU 1950 TaxID=3104321 RepID=UPI003EBEDEE2
MFNDSITAIIHWALSTAKAISATIFAISENSKVISGTTFAISAIAFAISAIAFTISAIASRRETIPNPYVFLITCIVLY